MPEIQNVQDLYEALSNDSAFYNREQVYWEDYVNQELTEILTSSDDCDFVAEFDGEYYLLETDGQGQWRKPQKVTIETHKAE